MRGISCYLNLSKIAKKKEEEGELLLFFSLSTTCAVVAALLGHWRWYKRRRSQMCLQSVPLAWLDTKVS